MDKPNVSAEELTGAARDLIEATIRELSLKARTDPALGKFDDALASAQTDTL